MRSMTSREIHNAIREALEEVSRALASGEIDRAGRYYSDSELRREIRNPRPRIRFSAPALSTSVRRNAKST